MVAKMFEAGFSVKPVIVVVAHHGDAAAGGGNDMVVLAEDLEETLGQRASGGIAAGVSHGLAAASLLRRELHVEAEAAEDAQRGDPDLGIKLVDVTRDEKTNVWHLHL
jgi:hypothetical protein